MINFYFNQLRLTVIFFITFSIHKCLSLSGCPTAVWSRNATTVAGSTLGEAGSTPSRLTWPGTVHVDDNNVLYVLDTSNYRVQRFFPNSISGTTVLNSSYGTELNQFSLMNSMSIDSNGSIYILDGYIGRVTKWIKGASTGTLVAGGNGIGNNTDQLNWSSGMFIDSNTLAIWIADSNNHRIVKWSTPTTSEVICGSFGLNNDQFRSPQGLFVDTIHSNILYVADSDNHRIQMWLPGSTSGITVAGITSYYGNGLNQLSWPLTLIVDTNENMFIVDIDNNRIMRWKIGAYEGVIIAGDKTYGLGLNQLANPMSISFDSNGALFVADSDNNRIQKFEVSCPVATNISTTTPSSVTNITLVSNTNCSMTSWLSNATTIAGSKIGAYSVLLEALYHPYDIWLASNDTMYVLDTDNYRVQQFISNSTTVVTVISGNYGSALNQFISMNSMSIDASGSIYILDGGNTRVTKWVPGDIGGIIVAGGNGNGINNNQLNNPEGIFVESETSIIWIADTNNHRIVKWESSSTGVTVCGSYGVGTKQFKYPHGVFVDTTGSNTFYVADTYNHRIQMWLLGSTSGGVTVAGETAISGDGFNRLSHPSTLIVDASTTMYIVDTDNSRIIRWIIGSTEGMIIAGTSTYGSLPYQLNFPRSIKFDQSGALLVADTLNNRIQKFAVSCAKKNISSSNSSMILTSTIYFKSSSVITSSLTTTKSFAFINYYPQWSLMIFCFIVILINN